MAKMRLGAIASGLSGRSGNAVYVQTEDGTILRTRPRPTDIVTPAQRTIRDNMAHVSRHYRNMTPEQFKAWQDYIEKLPLAPGVTRRPKVFNAYSGLGCKFVQMFPQSAPPLDAPVGPFLGDAVRLTVSEQPNTLVFTADTPNAAPVVTELLLQPLKHGVQTVIADRYRSQGFVHFEAGILDFGLTVAPGWYASAYRFVHAETGQETAFVALPSIEVMI